MLFAGRSFKRALIVGISCLGLFGPLAGVGAAQAAAAAGSSSPLNVGKAWQPSKENGPDGQLGQFSSGSPQESAERAAAAQARATGKPVVVGSLTSGTQLVTAEPDGTLAAASNVLPVRVRARASWVPVDTRLRLSGDRLAPMAVPGDSVSFSAGGSAAAAEISDGGAGLNLWWPGTLPVPDVSGASATYRNVLPGVNLVLTAVSGKLGGFSEVLIVTSRQAAGDPGLARLAWRVSAPGTSGMRALPDGGLLAQISGSRGFMAAAPVMWDSSALAVGASRAAVRTAQNSARASGAALAAGGMGAVSTVAGPASGAHEASITAQVAGGGSELSLTPDTRLLSSPATRFPVFIDPTFTPYDDTAGTQAYDTVQSQCTSPHYSTTVNSTSDSPVGFDNWGGSCAVDDVDYTLYQVEVPSGALSSDAHLLTASFQIAEGYSSDCSSTAVMTATWIGGISKSTGWPGPGAVSGEENVTANLGPDTSSCNGVFVENNGATVSTGFDVATDLGKIGSSATNITFRVWENPANNTADPNYPSEPSYYLHKQLTVNPTLEVHWIYNPDVPSDLEQASNNGGASSSGCVTTLASAPHIGKTIAQGGVYLLADLNEPTHGSQKAPDVGYNVRYATGTSSSPTWTTETDVQTGANGLAASYKLPASVTSGVADGTIVQWEAQADIGTATLGGTTYGPYTSSWSKSPCFFAVYPDKPDAPTLKADFSQTAGQTVGANVTFTITQSSGDTASEFVWGADSVPPTSSPPADRTCTTSAAETYCSKITGGSATLTIPVESPGPHDVWVYEVDSAGNDSGMTNDAPSGQSNTYEGAGDPVDSYTADGSLQANFTDALDAGKDYDNTMISREAGSQDGASADAVTGGNSFDEQEFRNAGWNPSTATVVSTVTVDGATFTMPKFGTTTSGPDNLLAANQLIGAGVNGAQGTSLVFLATSTHASVVVPGNSGSGASDSGVLSGDVTAPMTDPGYGVTGTGCALEASYDDSEGCKPATGTINFLGTCSVQGATITQTSYTLAVPDWVSGPSDIAALTLPDRDHAGGLDGSNPNLYVFSVPIPGSCTVASVQLPDVAPDAAGPALHILGMTLRNTTTATPQVEGAMPASPSGQGWTGAYASAIDNAYDPPSGKTWGNQTVRIAVSPGVIAPASTSASPVDVRIRLSDPGYWSEDGTGPLKIGAVSIAPQSAAGSPAAAAAPTPLTFDGSTSVSIPEGGDIYSDPVQLPFAVAPGSGILVSLYLQNASLPVLPLNNNTSGAETWFAPSSTPDEAGVQAGTAFTGSGGYVTATVPVLTGVDVTTPAVAGVSPGEPTVMVTGDGGIIEGELNPIPSDAANDPSQRLAGQLISQGDTSGYGVVDTSVEDNMVLFDAVPPDGGVPPNGLELQARLDHDVLAEPDLGTVIVNIGLEDMLWEDGTYSGMQTTVENTIAAVARQLGASGFVTGGGFGGVTLATQTPCNNYASVALNGCDQYVDAGRVDINDKISGLSGLACEADFSSAVTQPGTGTDSATNPATLITADDAGDHANLSLGASGGYAAIAPVAASCGFYPPASPLPPTS